MAYMQSTSIDDFEEVEVPLGKPPPPSEAPLRVFSGTYNVRGRPNINENGILEKIQPQEVAPWLSGMERNGEPLPELLFFSLEEVMDLNSMNVVIDSIVSSEDHVSRVNIWKHAILTSMNSIYQSSSAASDIQSKYKFIGQSTMVGLALLVFGTERMSSRLVNIQTSTVKTGWGGFLGNKGSAMWRCEVGVNGPSVCAVASHFASGRPNVQQRNECYESVIQSRVFYKQKRASLDEMQPPRGCSSSGVNNWSDPRQRSSSGGSSFDPSKVPSSSSLLMDTKPPPPPPPPRPATAVSAPPTLPPRPIAGSAPSAPPLPPRAAGGGMNASKVPPPPPPKPRPPAKPPLLGGSPTIPPSPQNNSRAKSPVRSRSPMRFLAGSDGRPKSASKLFGEAVNFGSTFTTKMESILFDNETSASSSMNSSYHGQRQQYPNSGNANNNAGVPATTLASSSPSQPGSIPSPPPIMFGVLDHDLLIWSGDLNYALNETIDGDRAIQLITSCKPFTEPPLLLEEAVKVTDHWHEQFAAADQLTFEKSQGKVFNGFSEGPLEFRPTYRVLNGQHEYDPKRCPAWTDRVLWRERKAIGKMGGGQQCHAVKCLTYDCAWSCKLSDHKPVYALLQVDMELLVKPRE